MLNVADRTAALSTLIKEEVDPEFLPYLDIINAFDFIVTAESCSGHAEFEGFPGRFGYLQIVTEYEFGEWFCENFWYSSGFCEWLIPELSQVWVPLTCQSRYEQPGAIQPGLPGVTKNASYQLTFVWKADDWPKAIEDVCEAIREFSSISLSEDEEMEQEEEGVPA